MSTHDYNYESFPIDLCAGEFEAFREAVPAGSPAPDGTLVDAATGEPVSLSTFWKRGPVLIEFGSIT